MRSAPYQSVVWKKKKISMIRVEERRKRNLGGITSLFVYGDLDDDAMKTLGAFGTYAYDKKTGEVEMPITALSYVLDNMTCFDDVSLSVMDEPSESANNFDPDASSYKTKPFDYQLEGISFGLSHDRFLLLDAPGLGKSLQVICLAEELRRREGIKHCLIICGIASLKTNWEREIAKHSDLGCRVIGKKVSRNGTVSWAPSPKRVAELKSPIDEFFVIINVEMLRNDDVIKALSSGANEYGMIAVDEIHRAKGWASDQGENLLKLSAPHMVAMTGTLITSNPLDAYVPLAWIGVEPKRSVTKFKNTFCVMDERTRGRILAYKNLDVLQNEVESCSIRRTKDMLNLPDRTFIDEHLDMPPKQASLYEGLLNAIREDGSDEAIRAVCDKVELSTNGILSLIVRLKQATTCPSVLTSQDVGSIKLDRAEELVREIVGNGEKVVVFSTFKEPIRCLSDRLSDLNPLVGTGDTPDGDVSFNIDEFQRNPNRKVFLGTVSKMGTGVTLTSASYMVFVDQPWTASDYYQACDRIHRIGAKRPVFVYNLLCDGTIDDRISEVINEKQAMSDYIVDGSSDTEVLATLEGYVRGL